MLIAAVAIAGLALLSELDVLEDESSGMEVTITRLRTDRVLSVAYVQGIAEVKRDCDYAQIEFRLIWSDGSVVGTAVANELNLRAGDTWRFEALGTYTRLPTRAEVASVVCY